MFTLRRRKKTQPRRYTRQCICGELISGLRSQETQRKSCPACGEQHTFLPTSPYPVPRPPRGYVPRVPAESEKTRLAVEQPKEERKNPFKWLLSQMKEKKKPEEIDKIKVETRVSMQQRLRTTFTPVRLLIIGCALVLMFTSWLVYHRQQVSWAEEVYTTAVTRAEEAFSDRDFENAKSGFAEASKAATILGLQDDVALSVQQKHREFDFISDLGYYSLYSILSDRNYEATNKSGHWARYFNRSYAGNRLLLDVRGELITREDKKWIQVNCPVIEGKGVLQLRIPLNDPGVSLLTYPDESTHLIAGARIYGCRKHEEKLNTWIIDFDEVLVWNSSGTLEMAGLKEEDEETREQLERILAIQALKKTEDELADAGESQEENDDTPPDETADQPTE